MPGARGRRWTSSSRSTRCRAAASGSGSRRTTSASAASRSPASTTSASSRTRCSSAPTTPSRSPSTRRSSTTASSSEKVDESGTVNRKILLVAAYREPIERYVEAFRRPGSSSSASTSRRSRCCARSGPRPSDGTSADAAVVVVNAGHERTTLAVSDGSLCEFTRVLEWGGTKLASAVARELHITAPEAEELLPSSRSSRRASERPRRDRRSEQAREAVRRELQALARELVASLEYYQAQARIASDLGDPARRRHEPHPRPRGRARAADARARAPRRSARPRSGRRLARSSATTWPRWQSRSDWGWRTDARGQPSPRAEPAATACPTLLTTKSVLAGGATLVTAVGLACGVTFVQSHDRASDRHDTLAGAAAAGRRARGRPDDRTAAAKSSDGARVAAFTTAASARMRWDNLLDDVSRVLPAGSWLSSLEHAGGHGGAGNGLVDAGDADRPDHPDRVHRLGRRVHHRTSSPA